MRTFQPLRILVQPLRCSYFQSNLIYDNRGNLNTETRGPAVTATTAYDGHGRLIGYSRTSEDSLAHSYNGLDDRTATARTPAGGGNADIRRFVTAPDGRAMGEYGSSASDVRAEFIWLSLTVGDPRSGSGAGTGMFGGDDGLGGYMPIALVTTGGTLSWAHLAKGCAGYASDAWYYASRGL